MKLSHAQRTLLTECLSRTQEIATTEPPPAWQKYAHSIWKDENECGPIYSCRDWFGRVTPAERMRFYRALRAIEDAELVEVTRITAFRSRTIIHLKLTDAGGALASKLIEETTAVAK